MLHSAAAAEGGEPEHEHGEEWEASADEEGDTGRRSEPIHGSRCPAVAADPVRWTLTGTTSLPLVYWQGVTVDPQRNLYFDGIFSGLYRTDPALHETAGSDDAIPPDVRASEGYNHIGDLSWDARESGRLLLPLECYYPGEPHGGNTCQTGSIGVADPQTLQWRYHVKLDPAEIRKAMWNELSPDGELVWTSSGPDLLAYRTEDVTEANAAPAGPAIQAARRLVGAVPPSGITGATFVDGRLFVSGQGGGPFRVWSVDLTTGARVLEIEREIVGESEGLATASVNGGTLQWLILPFNPQGRPPTYGPNHATLLSFRPGPPDPPPPAAPAPGPAAAPSPPPPAGSPRVRLLRRSRATVLRQRRFSVRVSCPAACTVRITVRARGRTIARGSTRHSGTARVRLTATGRRILRDRSRPVRLTLLITVRDAAGKMTRRTVRAVLR
jgi:hypothetical protein